MTDGFEGFPLILGWELTLACNLRCRHCGSSAGAARGRELTTDEALAICAQLPSLLVQEVDFTGGEPLLRPDWPEIAGCLHDLGIQSQVLTNGLTLDRALVSRIQEAGIAGVGVSLDGLQETHDTIRGYDGLFRKALAGIECLLAAGMPVTVLTTVNGLNIGELLPMMTLLRSVGVRIWQLQPVFPLGRVQEDDRLRLSEQDYLALGEFVREQWQPAEEAGFGLLPADSYGYFTDLDPREPPWRGCPAGLLTCGITSDGKIKGCLSMPDELVEGDLRKQDLWEIWFGERSFAYNRGACVEDLGPHCEGCEKGEECLGGCSSMSYGSTGRFHNDPFCFHGIRSRRRTSEPARVEFPMHEPLDLAPVAA